jgi:hypothetical protein
MLMFAALMLSVGVSFAQPACPSNGYFHNCFGTYTFANEDTYTGDWKDGKKNGHGTYTFANGNTYAGEWSGDKKNGQGIYTLATGDTYSGEWSGDEKNGHGTYTFANGDKYVGDWKSGKRNGQGTSIWNDGAKYVGEWKDNKFLYGSKTPPPLLTAFINLSDGDRKKVQSILSDLGFYKSSIDGLYGKGTLKALTAYNKKNLNDDDITKSGNVMKLITILLDNETSPTLPLLEPKD